MFSSTKVLLCIQVYHVNSLQVASIRLRLFSRISLALGRVWRLTDGVRLTLHAVRMFNTYHCLPLSLPISFSLSLFPSVCVCVYIHTWKPTSVCMSVCLFTHVRTLSHIHIKVICVHVCSCIQNVYTWPMLPFILMFVKCTGLSEGEALWFEN